MANSVYRYVTERILSELSKGVVPWKRSWGGVGFPVNRASGKPYRGVNSLLLPPGEYLTFKQARDLGGSIKKGEAPFMVVFYRMIDRQEEEAENRTGNSEDTVKRIPLLRYYRVYEIGQCDGIDRRYSALRRTEAERIEAAEAIRRRYSDPPAVVEKGMRACYSPILDLVMTPPIENFHSDEEYYSTLFHELVHSTGHPKRLNRKFGAFGNDAYSFEELVAEIGGAMLCGMSGIVESTIENSAAYIRSWSKRLRQDDTLIVKAASAAQKAADLVSGNTHEGKEEFAA